MIKRNIVISAILFSISFIYYYALSAKIWTWLYITGDTGDWLLFTNKWVVPQPFGSPLFISVVRLLGIAFPNADSYSLLNISLAVIPGAILVVLTYFIAKELTKSWQLGIVASIVLMGMSIATTQATVFEQYTFAAIFLTGAYLAYAKNRLVWAVVLLGLATANHAIVAVVALLWFAILWRQYPKKQLLKLSGIYLICGGLPYVLILYLLATCDSLFYTGGLSWEGLNVYLGTTYLVGNLSISVIFERLFDVGATLLMMLGLACLPLVVSFKKPLDDNKKLALVIIAVMLWFWFSNCFFSTFKYMVMATPIIAVYVAVGLYKLKRWHSVIVTIGAVVLIIANSVFLNANTLAMEAPLATEFYEDIWELPDNSAVITPRGGAYGFSFFYALSEGKELIPLLATKALPKRFSSETVIDSSYKAYLVKLKQEYDFQGNDSIELSQEALDKGLDLYFLSFIEGNGWEDVYEYEATDNPAIQRITGVKFENWRSWIDYVESKRELKRNPE